LKLLVIKSSILTDVTCHQPLSSHLSSRGCQLMAAVVGWST